MALRIFPIRPQIFEQVRRLGVPDGDWPVVIIVTLASFATPYILGHPGVALFSWLGALGGSVAFFNWARIGRRPLWLWHRLRSLFESGYRGRSLGCDHRKRQEQLPFIIDAEEHEDLAPASLLA
jgi:hypothetical protein